MTTIDPQFNIDSFGSYTAETVYGNGKAKEDRIKRFLDCPSWICECKTTNFGRNKYCANWICNKDRPSDFVETEI